MCKKSVLWLYRLESSFSWHSGLQVAEDHVFLDSSGKVRLIVERGGRITVTRGYAWNGCSPKVCLFDLLLGTPDGVVHVDTGKPKAYFASMVHDALYQSLRAGSPLTRQQADKCFLRLLAASDFSPRYLYWAAVRLFGGLVWRGKQITRHWQGTSFPVTELTSAPGPA